MTNLKFIKLFIFLITFSFIFINSYQIYAHQPYKVNNSNIAKPVIEISDASVSHAFYGEFLSKNEEVIFNLNGFSKNILQFSILIPDKNPENILLESDLPEIYLIKNKLTDPDNEEKFYAKERINFYEPFSKMNLIRVITYKDTILPNSNVSIRIKSNSAARYVFSVGYKEIFSKTYTSGETEVFTSSDMQNWYSKNYEISTDLLTDLSTESSTDLPTESSSLPVSNYLIIVLTCFFIILLLVVFLIIYKYYKRTS
jgi:hypothetical protein